MPRYAIAINGQNHVFEGPNPDAAARFARQWAQDNPQAAGGGGGGGLGGSVLGGLVDTFNRAVPGLSEMGAGLAAGGGVVDDLMAGRPADFGARWTQARAHQQMQIDQLHNDHPVAANLTTGVGLAAPLLAAFPTGGATAAPMMAEGAPVGLRAAAARLATAAGRNALTGAAIGGAYGASQPGTLNQRLGAADRNLLPGAAAGVAGPALLGATRAGAAAAGALARTPMIGALARGETEIRYLPQASDDLYDAAVRGTDRRGQTPAMQQIPWSVEDHLKALPASTLAAPDDEYAASDRIQNNRLAGLSPDIQDHFHANARDVLLEPITDDPDFKGYSGSQVADLRSKLSNIADHYRPQGDNGQTLANEIDQMNTNFTAMAGRTQPEFAKAMAFTKGLSSTSAPPPITQAGVFDPSRVLSMTKFLPMSDHTVAFLQGDSTGGVVGALPTAANENLNPADQPLQAPAGAPSTIPVPDPPEDPEARFARLYDEIGPEAMRGYDYAGATRQRLIRAKLSALSATDTDAPLPDSVVNLGQWRQARAALAPTLESAAAASPPEAGDVQAAPNAFTGVKSNIDLASAIASRAANAISGPELAIPGLNAILPLATGRQNGPDSPSPQQGQ